MDETYLTNPTMDELEAALGPRWAVCRNTANNRNKYSVCLSTRKYTSVIQACLHNPATPDPRLAQARALHREATALIESI